MSFLHKNLAAGRWRELSFAAQMANIGSEVERALNWKVKDNNAYCQAAFERALELIDLTLDNLTSFPRLKEIARMREALVEYFYGENQFGYSDESLRKYFFHFAFASRKHR